MIYTDPLRNHPNKPLYDITLSHRLLRSKQMTAYSSASSLEKGGLSCKGSF